MNRLNARIVDLKGFTRDSLRTAGVLFPFLLCSKADKYLNLVYKMGQFERLVSLTLLVATIDKRLVVQMEESGIPAPFSFRVMRPAQSYVTEQILAAPTGAVTGFMASGMSGTIEQPNNRYFSQECSQVKYMAPVIKYGETVHVAKDFMFSNYLSGMGLEFNNPDQLEYNRKSAYVMMGGLFSFKESKEGAVPVSGKAYIESNVSEKGVLEEISDVTHFYNFLFGFDKMEENCMPVFGNSSRLNIDPFCNVSSLENYYLKGIPVEGKFTPYTVSLERGGGLGQGHTIRFSNLSSVQQTGYSYAILDSSKK